MKSFTEKGLSIIYMKAASDFVFHFFLDKKVEPRLRDAVGQEKIKAAENRLKMLIPG